MTICAEFALLRLWSKGESPRAVCIKSYQEMVDQRVKVKFGSVQGGKKISSLLGERSADLSLLEKGDVLVCTLTQIRYVFHHIRSIFVAHLDPLFICSGMLFLEDGDNAKVFKPLAS